MVSDSSILISSLLLKKYEQITPGLPLTDSPTAKILLFNPLITKEGFPGLISGKDNSYISLVNSGGEVLTVTLGQFLGKIKLVDMRLNEAIFEKEDKSFIIIDFNNVIREANEY